MAPKIYVIREHRGLPRLLAFATFGGAHDWAREQGYSPIRFNAAKWLLVDADEPAALHGEIQCLELQGVAAEVSA